MEGPQIQIEINKTYDPLTLGSYRNPHAPWVGIDPGNELEVSPAIARLQRLMQEYVHCGTASCSILIGGDRGAGKTSLVKKTIERLSWDRPKDPQELATRPVRWKFPRPLYVRVHGPRCMEFDLKASEERDGASTKLLRQVAEALHRALIDELGRAFAQRGELTDDSEVQEQVAQFKLEMDEGPNAARLREMWTLFAAQDGKAEAILPEDTRVEPRDQVYRELLAVASSIQLILEVRTHQAQEERWAKSKGAEEAKREEQKEKEDQKHKDDFAFWKELARQMMDGGRLFNPLAGFLVTALVFVSVLKSGTGIPISVLIAVLSGFSTTILLNLATARRYNHALLSDSKLAAMDRMLPMVLRRLENAGIFPIIVIDELDKVEGDLAERMNHLTRDLKNFVADQAFVCFLVGRKYYEQVLEASAGEIENRRPVDTFFSDRILVSHTPDSLLSYLDELLKPQQNSPDAEKTCTFLKHLYLYRAKGHLGDLQEAIAADHKLDYSVVLSGAENLYEVPEYRNQVFYQLAVHRVISDRSTQTVLRQKPDLLQPLNQALYGPAQNWESGKWSFVPRNFGQNLRARSTADANFCIEPLERLMAILLLPDGLTKDPDTCRSHRLCRDLEVLGTILNQRSGGAGEIKSLVSPDSRTPPERYFWETGFREGQEFVDPARDKSSFVQFRDNEEEGAIGTLDALSNCLANLSDSAVSIATLCDLKASGGTKWSGRLIEYTFAKDLPWIKLRSLSAESRRRKEICELYHAITQSSGEIRGLLLVACLTPESQRAQVTAELLTDLYARATATAADRETLNDALATGIDQSLKRLHEITGETVRAINGLTQINQYDIPAWCVELQFIANRIR